MDDGGVSGITTLILQAELDALQVDERMARVIRGAHQCLEDMLAKNPENLSWGGLYLDECKRRALAAVHDFAGADNVDLPQALALHATLREYRRVAEFADSLLRHAADAVRVMNGEEPLDDGVGEPLDGAGTDGYGQVDD